LAVARKLVAYMLAVEKSKQNFQQREPDKAVNVKQVVAFFPKRVVNFTAKSPHDLRRIFEVHSRPRGNFAIVIPISNIQAAFFIPVVVRSFFLNFFKTTSLAGFQFLVLPDHLSGYFDLAS